MNDKTVNLVAPLKGPFKGKGENRRYEQQLIEELNNIEVEMKQLINHFNQTLPSPRIVNLVIMHRTWPLLWWREPKSSGTYLRLFETVEGRILLKKLLPVALRLYTDFDHNRALLNYRSRMVGNSLKATQLYRECVELHDTLRIKTAG